jgi:hypothetical protein
MEFHDWSVDWPATNWYDKGLSRHSLAIYAVYCFEEMLKQQLGVATTAVMGGTLGAVAAYPWTITAHTSWELGKDNYWSTLGSDRSTRHLLEVTARHETTNRVLRFYVAHLSNGGQSDERGEQLDKINDIISSRTANDASSATSTSPMQARIVTAAENRSISTTALLEGVRAELRQLAGHLPLPRPGAVTFISRRVPWGFAFPEIPSTHLFSYPDLGIALINGVTVEQADAPGIRSAAILDPGAVDSREIQAAIERLTDRGVLSIGIRSKLATVHRVAQTIEHFPLGHAVKLRLKPTSDTCVCSPRRCQCETIQC